jgi:hypothetical protein
MADEGGMGPKDFAASFKKFLDVANRSAGSEEPYFVRRLREHFGMNPAKLPLVSEAFRNSDHPNLQVALDAWLAAEGRGFELEGVVGDGFMGVSLADLLIHSGLRPPPNPGPVQYVNHPLHEGVIACTQSGLYLVKQGSVPLALYVHGKTRMQDALRVDVLATDKETADRTLGELRAAMKKKNVYRGHVVSLGLDDHRALTVEFHRLPTVQRDGIILGEGLLTRIERLTVGFSKNREKLAAAGRHLKRGLLLHGPPGTGKTLTAMYLSSQMRDRTVILITGRGMGLLSHSCAMARALQPAIVVLEDVDLIAEDRSKQNGCNNGILFDLLNEMDGLTDDADVIFLLTTNRPDILEPALAARPGRIDPAIEVPLPDTDCRRRLLELYGRGLALEVKNLDSVVDRTDGASAAFMRELVRKAAVFAADAPGEKIVVRDSHFDEALHELVVEGGDLTRSLLGGAKKPGG